MTYDPQDEDAFRVGLLSARGDGATWRTTLANDAHTYELYTPGFEANVSPSFSALARTYRFRVRGNQDDRQVQIDFRGDATVTTQTVTVATSAAFSDRLFSAAGWYGAALSAAGPIDNCSVTVPATGAGLVQIQAIRCHVVSAAPSAGVLYASGYRLNGARWGVADAPIATGQLSRILANATRVAIERPYCVAVHLADCEETITGKSAGLWGVEDSTQWTTVGRMKVPRCDNSTRLYTVDAYTVESSSGGEYRVNIGGIEEAWTGIGWHSWQVRLGPGPHDLRASVMPGASNAASIRTLQVWRTDADA